MSKIVSFSVLAVLLLLSGTGHAEAKVQGACTSKTWTIVEVRDGHTTPYLNFSTVDGYQEAFGLKPAQWVKLKAQYGNEILGLQFCGDAAVTAIQQIVGD